MGPCGGAAIIMGWFWPIATCMPVARPIIPPRPSDWNCAVDGGGGDGGGRLRGQRMIMCSFQRIVNKWLRQRRGQPAGHAGLETCLIAKTWES